MYGKAAVRPVVESIAERAILLDGIEQAQIFFLGAEFTREYATRLGSKRGDAELQAAPANDDVVERAQKIVKGEDPVLLRKK